MVYTVFYKTSSFAGYCFLDKNSINPKRYDVFSFKAFNAILVKIQFCSFIVINREIRQAILQGLEKDACFEPLRGRERFQVLLRYVWSVWQIG